MIATAMRDAAVSAATDAGMQAKASTRPPASTIDAAIDPLPIAEHLQAAGYRFAVATRSQPACRLLRNLYEAAGPSPDGAPVERYRLEAASAPAGSAWRVLRDDELLAERPSLGAALRQLEYQVCLRVLELRRDLLALHGATVAGAERTAFITGASGAGKTTLALALAARGYRVGADDLAFLDPASGLVAPLPRCAHLDARARRLLRGAGLRLPALAARHGFVAPADLGGGPFPPSRLDLLVHLDRGNEARPRLTPASQAELLALLLRESGAGDDRVSDGLAALARLVGGARCFRLLRGRLSATVEAVVELLGPPAGR